MGIGYIVVTTLACLAALVLASYGVEALRRVPSPPDGLSWAPDIAVGFATIGGVRLRHVKTGSGPNLVLLHTLRTQLDIFQYVIPELSRQFTVYAFDFPGHGWSDIPPAEYAPADFYEWTTAFLEAFDIEHATLAGISIGGTIALVLAARGNPRIGRVIAINPYDYWPAGGIRKSSLAARLILGPAGVPIFGATLMRLRTRFITDQIMAGGVATATALPPALRQELYEVGARPGQYRGFLSLLAHEALWADARKEYIRILIPTLLVYGDRDWASGPVRDQERALLPNAITRIVAGGGHFLSLDRPRELIDIINSFTTAQARTERTP
jgi:pimeloyl-ACP methyl ester carboxylesterase